jgi:hypothetical protein
MKKQPLFQSDYPPPLLKWRKVKRFFLKIHTLITNKPLSIAPPPFNPQPILEQAQDLKHQKKMAEAIQLLEDASKDQDNFRIMHLLANLLLEAGHYQKIYDLPQIRQHDSRSYAIASALLAQETASVAPLCRQGHEPLANAALVTMIKDEADIILYNLMWHYSLGFRKFFIIDNLSADQTIHKIKLFEEQFSDTMVYILHDPVVAHFQGKKITGACRFVMALWPELEWLALVDGDEFLCTTEPLHSVLAALPEETEAVILPKSVYYLVSGDTVEEGDIFYRRIRHRTQVSHISSKVIMRARADFDVRQGNHRIFGPNGQEITAYTGSPQLTLREFPVRSRTHFKRKITNGGKAIAEAKRVGFNNVGGGHWELLYGLYQKEGETGLNRKFEEILQRNSSQATLTDPFPLDEVIAELSAQKAELLAALP